MVAIGTVLVVLAALGVFFSLIMDINFATMTNNEKNGFVHLSFFAAIAVLICGVLVLAL